MHVHKDRTFVLDKKMVTESWGEAETGKLVELWSDDHVQAQLA